MIVNTRSDKNDPPTNERRAILVPINRSVNQRLSVDPIDLCVQRRLDRQATRY